MASSVGADRDKRQGAAGAAATATAIWGNQFYARVQIMTVIDYVTLGILLISGLISFFRGFIKEAISLAMWVVAVYLAIWLAPVFAAYLSKHIGSTMVAYLIAFIALFVVVLVLGMVVNFLVGLAIHSTGIGPFDRVVGVVFGLVRGALLVSVLLLMIGLTPLQRDQWVKKSVLAPHFLPMVQWIRGYIPKNINELGSHSK